MTNRIAQVLLVVYFVGSVAVALPLLFSIGRAGDLVDTTSGKILGAAVLSLGIGALLAARDPWRNHVMIQVLVVFTSLSTLAIVYRLVAEDHADDPAWFLLFPGVAAPVLFLLFYPRAQSKDPQAPGQGPRAPGQAHAPGNAPSPEEKAE